MKTIGLIGGMTWHSTVEYYKYINEQIHAKLGSDHSARILMYSLDYEELKVLRDAGRFQELSEILTYAALTLETAGAEAILLCANTAHKSAPEIEKRIQIPLLHIGKALGAHAKTKGYKTVGFLGTLISMEGSFVTKEIENFGIRVITPNEKSRIAVNEMIAKESPPAKLSTKTIEMAKDVLNDLVSQGCESIVLGCTELPLMIEKSYCSVSLIDSTLVHATSAVEFALNKH